MIGIASPRNNGAQHSEPPRLVSYPLCPFVQRVAIALQVKGVDYRITYVDLADPPDWFRAASPRAKVPLLMTDHMALFESGAILEYIDEVYRPRLQPEAAEQRARERAWMETGNEALWEVFELSVAPDAERFDASLVRLHERLDRVEGALAGTPFFRGPAFGLVDATWAPLFQRMEYLDAVCPGIVSPQRHPRTIEWKRTLLSHPAVRRSHVPDLESLYRGQLARRQGYAAQLMGMKDEYTAAAASTY